MANSDIWFPLYVGDYMADTLHLDTTEHGAYFLLLCAYYKKRGPLPDDDQVLAKIVRQTVTDWQKTRLAMAQFFQIEGGQWRHRRADFEISRRVSAQSARIQGARETNRKLGRTVTDTVTDTVSEWSPTRSIDAIPQSQSQSQSEPDSKSESKPKIDVLTHARVLIHYLNEKTGFHYREVSGNLTVISQRLKEPDVTLDGCRQMIDRQVLLWKGGEMEKYLRPETLFGKQKFDSYYALKDVPAVNHVNGKPQTQKPDYKNGF